MGTSSQTQPTLLERLRDGLDPLAWDEFFQRYWHLIYAYAKYRGCSDHTAEEIVQEVMLAVFENRDIYRYDPGRGRFRDWLGTVVRNKVTRHRRRPAERYRARGGEPDDRSIEPEADDASPDAAWEGAFQEALLLVLLDMVRQTIAPRTYQAFELFTFYEMPGAEVARLTGISRNAVYQARKEVLKRLRQLGATYREDGQLDARVKQALQSRPGAAVERSVTTRIANTMRSR